jgi:catechol 2,3-dioxygenase-like lactoylglutathione lyase family enzyme
MMSEAGKTKLSFFDKGIAQVAIIVPDLEEAVENYWKLFGIDDWHFYTYGKPLVKRMTYQGEPSDYKMRVALSYLGPMRIELIEMIEGDTVYADFVKEHGYGVHHFGVLVEDMGEAIADAEAAGLAMTQDGAGFGRDGDGHFAYLGHRGQDRRHHRVDRAARGQDAAGEGLPSCGG